MKIRYSKDRGQSDHGWLKAKHTFSFANYYDPNHMGFHHLRVINEDIIAGHNGFGKHPHKNMEILTFLIKGSLTHEDSLGSNETLLPGDIQIMSAGTGVSHSEMNTDLEDTHLYQIWIEPSASNVSPAYKTKNFRELFSSEGDILIASPTGHNNSLTIGQQVEIWSHQRSENQKLSIPTNGPHPIWIQVVKGKLRINDAEISAGDAVSFEADELLQSNLSIETIKSSQILVFHLLHN